jgi:hypothetical protein
MKKQGNRSPSKVNSSTIKDLNGRKKFQTKNLKTITRMINEIKEVYKCPNECKEDSDNLTTN